MTNTDLIPISLLSQYYYCRRRAGLLLLEGQWEDNRYTVEGTFQHEHVHSGINESRNDLYIIRSLRLSSEKYGITGVADCIEFHRTNTEGVCIKGKEGKWIVIPVEYKHGRKRSELEYEVQLCAQAMCIEEALDTEVSTGFLYYFESNKRKKVNITEELRKKVTIGINELSEMIETGKTPLPVKSAKCIKCSMYDKCIPNILRYNSQRYICDMLNYVIGDNYEEDS